MTLGENEAVFGAFRTYVLNFYSSLLLIEIHSADSLLYLTLIDCSIAAIEQHKCLYCPFFIHNLWFGLVRGTHA